MPTVSGTQSNDFDHGNVLRQTFASGTSGVQTWGPFRLPTFGEQSAEIVTLWLDGGTTDFTATVQLLTQAGADDASAQVGEDVEIDGTSGGVQAVYVGGDYVTLSINFTAATSAEVNCRPEGEEPLMAGIIVEKEVPMDHLQHVANISGASVSLVAKCDCPARARRYRAAIGAGDLV